MLIGHYDERGYDVVEETTGEILYTAGNHALESTQDAMGTEFQLPIIILGEFCRQTTHEMAQERNERYHGAIFYPERSGP